MRSQSDDRGMSRYPRQEALLPRCLPEVKHRIREPLERPRNVEDVRLLQEARAEPVFPAAFGPASVDLAFVSEGWEGFDGLKSLAFGRRHPVQQPVPPRRLTRTFLPDDVWTTALPAAPIVQRKGEEECVKGFVRCWSGKPTRSAPFSCMVRSRHTALLPPPPDARTNCRALSRWAHRNARPPCHAWTSLWSFCTGARSMPQELCGIPNASRHPVCLSLKSPSMHATGGDRPP